MRIVKITRENYEELKDDCIDVLPSGGYIIDDDNYEVICTLESLDILDDFDINYIEPKSIKV